MFAVRLNLENLLMQLKLSGTNLQQEKLVEGKNLLYKPMKIKKKLFSKVLLKNKKYPIQEKKMLGPIGKQLVLLKVR
jgi:hypothetical protein